MPKCCDGENISQRCYFDGRSKQDISEVSSNWGHNGPDCLMDSDTLKTLNITEYPEEDQKTMDTDGKKWRSR